MSLSCCTSGHVGRVDLFFFFGLMLSMADGINCSLTNDGSFLDVIVREDNEGKSSEIVEPFMVYTRGMWIKGILLLLLE